MSIRRLAAMVAGLTLAAGPLTLQAQDNVEADVNIVREVSTRNLLELRLADMARKKTANASVKSFAEQMRTDHLEMNKQITSLVGQNGQPFKTGLGNVDAELEEVRRLDKMSGNQFDQEFMASMIRHHQDNVSYFQSTANSAQSNQVRTLLAQRSSGLTAAPESGHPAGPSGGRDPTGGHRYSERASQYSERASQRPGCKSGSPRKSEHPGGE